MKREPIENKPLVSVVTPLFNAERFIEETLKSVQQQSYGNWELLVVDDASNDGSASLVEKMAINDERIKLTRLTENKGAAYCRNLATEQAQGDFIAFLDSDDLWLSGKLEKQINAMIKNNVAVSFTSYLHMNEQGESIGRRIKAIPELTYQKQLRNNYIGNLTGMYNASMLGKILSPDLRKRQDWAVWLNAIKKSGGPALGIQEDLARYRVRTDSMSATKWRLVKPNYYFYRTHLGYSAIRSFFALLRFFWEYFLVRPRYIERY